MYKYFKIFNGEISTNQIKRISDGALIPFDPANTDYQAFLKYKEEGGNVYGPDEEVPTGE